MRNERHRNDYADILVQPITYTVDDMKEHFKEATKAYKAKKAEILKRQKQKG